MTTTTSSDRVLVAKVLRWLAIAAFLALPILFYLGRTRQTGCEPPVTRICDVFLVTPGWTVPVLLLTLALAIALLVIAGLVMRVSDE